MSRATLTVARHEIKSFLDRPAGWVLLVVFSALVDFLFFRAAFSSGEASLRPLFGILPWVFLIFVPAVTMRLLAEEERGGTIELLLTQPISELDVLVGKFLGGWAIVGMALATTVPVPLGLATAGRLDWGVVIAQYESGLLLAAALVAIGLLASALTRNQVMASILAAVTGFVLMMLGFELVTLTVPRSVAGVFTSLSLLSHSETMARGVVDLRDVMYFLSVVLLFGLGAYLVFHGKRANRRADDFYNLELGAILIVGIVIASNLLVAPFALRLDLTQNRFFTLSPATVKILRASPSQVALTLFASRELPPQVALTYRDVRDLLRDYAQSSRGRVQLIEKFPDVDPTARQAADALGVQPVQFNVVKTGQFSVQEGWLGVALQAGTKKEAIPFIQNAGDLEYQLTSLIRKMTSGSRRTVAFTAGHNERPATDYQTLRTELAKTYTVKDVSSTTTTGPELAGVRVLVINGPQTTFTAKDRAAVRRFIDEGGAALFMLEGYTINPQFMLATPNPGSMAGLTSKYGARVEKSLLYDVRSNESVSFSSGQQSYTVPYPFWPRLKALAAEVAGDLDTVVLPWPSPVTAPTTETPKGAQVIPLLTTSKYAGAEAGQPMINPDRQFPDDERSLRTYLGGAAVLGPPGKARWRIAVIGDSEFPSDQYAQNAPENVVLALNTIDWLAQDEALAAIRAKRSEPRQLRFTSFVQQALVTWGNQFGVPLLLAIVGTWHLVRRRRRARKGDAR